MMFDITKVTFQTFLSNKKNIEEAFSSMFFNNHPLQINKDLDNYKKLDRTIIYLGFIIYVSNFVCDELSKNNNLEINIKFSNINNISVTTIYLIVDVIILMLNRSVFGVNGLMRMIFENVIISLALNTADIVVNEKYFDWQVLDEIKYKKKLNKLERYKKDADFQIELNDCENRVKQIKIKYQIGELYNYGWASVFVNKNQNDRIEFSDIVDKVWDAPANPDVLKVYYEELNKYVHSTPSIIHSEWLNAIINGNIPLDSLYSKLILITSMALDVIYCGYSYIINELALSSSLEELNKINEYYRNELSK